MAALTSAEGAKFSKLSLLISIRLESEGSAINSYVKIREGETEASFTKPEQKS